MKNLISGILALLLTTGIIISGYGQCVPDTANCKDINEPGQVCPDTLPVAVLNTWYEQVFTIIPPYEFDLGAGVIPIYKIVLDTVINLPPGLTYEPNATELFPDSAYCVLISGTPTETGTFFLKICVTPFVEFMGSIVQGAQTVDDTSLFIIVQSTTGLPVMSTDQVTLLPVKPNPFTMSSRIGLTSDRFGVGNLYVFYITGQMAHHEEIWVQPGKNYFDFRGETLRKGIYLYKVSFMGKSFTSRVVKM
ncbi:MAG: hypothetical protein KAT38_04700 [Bacteroidales bacterium]|nr:hypothetical protein [Bacteroidales bacterium]